MSLGKIRPLLDRSLIAGDRFIEFALLLQGVAQIALGRGIVGLDFQGPVVAGNRFIQLALLLRDDSKIIVRLGVARLEFDRPSITCRGFLESADVF